MKKGIDLSYHNGDIDMEKIKNSNIEFIILRLGYGNKNLDKKFYENYDKAIQFQIPIGVYLYSYALNTEEALKEAEFVLNIVKGLKLEYPIFFDMEDADGYKRKHNMDYVKCNNICEAFCNHIEKAGYYVGIYANLDWLSNKINDEKLDRFDKWVAQWAEDCKYKKEFGMWQYSSKGKIDGIKGNVDLNYALKDYPEIIKKHGLNCLKSEEKIYVVQSGDSLIKIARKFNTDWKKIYSINKSTIGENPSLIKTGQKLIIKE